MHSNVWQTHKKRVNNDVKNCTIYAHFSWNKITIIMNGKHLRNCNKYFSRNQSVANNLKLAKSKAVRHFPLRLLHTICRVASHRSNQKRDKRTKTHKRCSKRFSGFTLKSVVLLPFFQKKNLNYYSEQMLKNNEEESNSKTYHIFVII